jgi:exonuclease III
MISLKKLDILHHCKDILEICAVQLETKTSDIIILSLYRAPSGDFSQFMKRLDTSLRYLFNPKSEFLMCGDINIDCLNENSWRRQLIIDNI